MAKSTSHTHLTGGSQRDVAKRRLVGPIFNDIIPIYGKIHTHLTGGSQLGVATTRIFGPKLLPRAHAGRRRAVDAGG